MPRVAPGQRKRAYRPKTRTGCQTCKVRHVKCDEGRPSCQKCLSTGRQCDGYETSPNETSQGALRQMSLPSTPTDTLISLRRSPSCVQFGTEKEHQAFHFFRQYTANQLAGFYADDFWNCLVLRATHYEPALHHAVVALGSLHERFLKNDGLISKASDKSDLQLYHDDFAVRQYNAAIQCLVGAFSRKEKQAMDVWLLSCILFACFETMQANYSAAIAHVRSGGKILCEIEYDNTNTPHHKLLATSEEPYVPMTTIRELFMRLNIQITRMDGGQPGHNWDVYSAYLRDQAEIPAMFGSVSEARNSLISNWHSCTRSMTGLSHLPEDEVEPVFSRWQANCLRVLEQWSNAFEALLCVQGDSMTINEKRGVDILRIEQSINTAALKLSRRKQDDQIIWDQFLHEFIRIVGLASEIVRSDTEGPRFSLDMGIVSPLYEVSTRCRDPVIRRQAISLLRGVTRQEGVWNSYHIAEVAERVVMIEEEGLGEVRCCSDVPDWARISDVSPTFDPAERRAVITYSRVGSANDFIRKQVEEVLEW